MKQYEKEEIKQLPDKYKPLGAWRYFGYNLLFSIPIVGLICLIVFACSSRNINRRSYARSFFCVLIIALVIVGVSLLFTFLGFGGEFLKEFFQGLTQGAGA
ncbi:MAG: hypothetical protein J1G02_02280 [Clostridiales bacterium]|nr:hypothetical protein [Clostridiales bacterium]